MLVNAAGNKITGISEWPQPKRGQWVDGRSAKELAKHWINGAGIPSDVLELLEKRFGELTLSKGQPEFGTNLPPSNSAGPRMHDLWFLCDHSKLGTITVCVEGKADETFSQTISKYEEDAQKKWEENSQSQAVNRLVELKKMIWDRRTPPNVGDLRYQLLSGLAGTGIQAAQDGSSTAVFLIHVFETSETLSFERARNDHDLYRFVETVSESNFTKKWSTRDGHFIAKTTVTVHKDFTGTDKAKDVEVYIAKLVTHVP